MKFFNNPKYQLHGLAYKCNMILMILIEAIILKCLPEHGWPILIGKFFAILILFWVNQQVSLVFWPLLLLQLILKLALCLAMLLAKALSLVVKCAVSWPVRTIFTYSCGLSMEEFYALRDDKAPGADRGDFIIVSCYYHVFLILNNFSALCFVATVYCYTLNPILSLALFIYWHILNIYFSYLTIAPSHSVNSNKATKGTNSNKCFDNLLANDMAMLLLILTAIPLVSELSDDTILRFLANILFSLPFGPVTIDVNVGAIITIALTSLAFIFFAYGGQALQQIAIKRAAGQSACEEMDSNANEDMEKSYNQA